MVIRCNRRDLHSPPKLTFLCERSIAIRMFQTNIRWRKIKDVAYALGDVLAQWRFSLRVKEALRRAIGEVLREVRRWDEKHREMFCDSKKSGRVIDRGEHLRTFYRFLLWRHSSYNIDDCATALHLMKTECSDWPQMQFQFACLYAFKDWIDDDFRFDKYRRMTLKKQLGDHPVYDFWLTLMDSDWEQFFDTETRLANQKLQLCFQFAITHGYFQLVQFIWDKIGDNTKEYIGFLQWRAMCFRTRDRDTMRFLCERLCQMNARSMARISSTVFWSTFYDMLNNEESDVVVQEKFKHRFIFLLDNCCPVLRRRLLAMEKFRMISDAFRYNRPDAFAIMLEHLDGTQLREATEVVDRIHGRRQSIEGEKMRRTMMRRQATTTD